MLPTLCDSTWYCLYHIFCIFYSYSKESSFIAKARTRTWSKTKLSAWSWPTKVTGGSTTSTTLTTWARPSCPSSSSLLKTDGSPSCTKVSMLSARTSRCVPKTGFSTLNSFLGVVHKWRHGLGEGVKDIVMAVLKYWYQKGWDGGGCQNSSKLRVVINVRILMKKKMSYWQYQGFILNNARWLFLSHFWTLLKW